MGRPRAKSDYYALLQVHPRAEAEVIEAAYRALGAAYPPGSGGKNDPAVEIAEAYDTLSVPSKRERYDAERSDARKGVIIGEYRVIEEIAEGGFGKTYKAEHLMLGEPVCIKQCSRISPQSDAILVEEAKAMWNLRHFGIPAPRTVLRLEDGSLALVMSYIPGPTLAQIVEKHGRLDGEHVAWIAQRILNVLMYLHHHGVVHGDLKPQNVIVQPDTHTVVLVDFGLSAVKPARGSKSKGYTDVFAPPEQLAGGTILPESDFYSLGMTMLHALNGGDIDRIESLEVPGDVPDALCRFIKRLIVQDVLDRPKWENENLFETIQKVREQSFGRSQSGMKPLPL
jgi:serine/threonine protein kinase